MRALLTCSLVSLLLLGAAPTQDDEKKKHLGGCILEEPVGVVPEDLYQVTDVVATEDYGPFARKLIACGIVLIAEDGVEDLFLLGVGQVIREIFREDESLDGELQEDVLRKLYEYRAVIPVPRTERSFELLIEKNEAAWERVHDGNSVCDIIMAEVPEGQVMEVVEHVLHIVTDVGLHHRFPAEWGITRESELWKAMQEAIAAGHYDVSSYRDLEGAPPEVRDRVLLQEFAYWFVTTAWDLQEPYGPDEEEWTIANRAELEEKLPEFFGVYERTVGRVMKAPTRATLAEIGPTRDEERSR